MNSTGRRGGVNPFLAGVVAGAVMVAVVGLMAIINLQFGAPWSGAHTLTAQVSDADSMAVGSDVRIAGRLVGQVTAINAAGDHADITFHVDAAEWPLPADTTASVRLATLLGQKYVQLNLGGSRQTLADDAVIPLRDTHSVVDFDQILDTFDKPTRDALTSLLRTGAAAVRGEEGTLQQLVPSLSELSVHSQVPTAELAARDPELNRILVHLGVTAEQLDRSREDLAGVIDHLNTVTAALASSQGAALKSYIAGTDALNQTTHAVLAGGNAAALDSGLLQLCSAGARGTCDAGLLGHLNTLLAALIPETAQAFTPCQSLRGCNVISDGNPSMRATSTPAEAGIDLIYEIGGSAVSQGDGTTSSGFKTANFFLRQYAQGTDSCGLTPCSASSAPTPAFAAQPNSQPAPGLPCIPLVTCPGSSPPPLPVPCIALLTGCPSPSPAPPTPTPAPVPVPSLPLPSLPVGISYHVTIAEAFPQWWPVRYR